MRRLNRTISYYMKSTFYFFFLFFHITGFAQITFERQYGNHSTYQGGWWIEPTFDGGYLIAGYGNNFPQGTGMPLLMKIDAYGDSVWSKILWGQPAWFGMEGSFFELHQLADSGFIVGGYRRGAQDDFFLMRINMNGDSVWTKLIKDSLTSKCMSVAPTMDGGFIAHTVNSIYKLYKFDSGGNVVWVKPFIIGLPWGYKEIIRQTSDSGYVLFGTSRNTAGPNTLRCFMAKFDSQGDSLWIKEFGSNLSLCYSGQQTADGGYVLCGKDHAAANNVFLAKTDANGDTLWTKYYGGAVSTVRKVTMLGRQMTAVTLFVERLIVWERRIWI